MRFIACCIVMLLLAGQAGAQTRQVSRRVDRELLRAERLLPRSRARALAALVRIAARNPSDARAALRYCDLTVPEASETFDALLSEPTRVQTEAAQCRALLMSREGVAARLAWVDALLGDATAYVEMLRAGGLDEGDIAPLRQAAALALLAGEARLAERALGYALHVRPQDPEIQRDVALLMLARGDAESALAYLRRFALLHPDDERAQRDYAGALLEAGHTTAAIAAFQALASRRPEHCEAWLSLARARVEAGDYAAGASDAARALSLAGPDDARAALVRGDALRLLRDDVGARAAYEEALRRDPSSTRARQALDALLR